MNTVEDLYNKMKRANKKIKEELSAKLDAELEMAAYQGHTGFVIGINGSKFVDQFITDNPSKYGKAVLENIMLEIIEEYRDNGFMVDDHIQWDDPRIKNAYSSYKKTKRAEERITNEFVEQLWKWIDECSHKGEYKVYMEPNGVAFFEGFFENKYNKSVAVPLMKNILSQFKNDFGFYFDNGWLIWSNPKEKAYEVDGKKYLTAKGNLIS